jgi:hypothetical protein
VLANLNEATLSLASQMKYGIFKAVTASKQFEARCLAFPIQSHRRGDIRNAFWESSIESPWESDDFVMFKQSE